MATIEKRGNSYRISVSDRYDITGKQLCHTMTWTPSPGMTKTQIKNEVKRQAFLFEEPIRTGRLPSSKMRFAEFADLWLQDYAVCNLRPTTLRSYRAIVEELKQKIVHIQIDQLNPLQIITLLRDLNGEGTAQKAESLRTKESVNLKKIIRSQDMTMEQFAPLSSISIRTLREACHASPVSLQSAQKISDALKTQIADLFDVPNQKQKLQSASIRKYFAVLSSMLATAVKWQMIPYNPCERVQPPKLDHKKISYLDDKQAAHLIELVKHDTLQHQVIVMLALFTGMRRGELCGLEWNDIDFQNNIIHVERASLYIPEKGIFTDGTKNDTSYRSIRVPQHVIDLLRQYRKQQLEQQMKLGDQWQVSGRILIKWNGAPIHPSTVTNLFRKFIDQSDLPQIHLHSMRHTNISLQIAGGIPLTTVAARAGHADSYTTTKIYAHEIKSVDEAAADYLDHVLRPPKTGKTKKRS